MATMKTQGVACDFDPLEPVNDDPQERGVEDTEQHILNLYRQDLRRLQPQDEEKSRMALRAMRSATPNSAEWTDARNQVVEMWLPFAFALALKKTPYYVDRLDRVGLAGEALIRAVEKLDPEAPSLRAYIATVVKNAIWDASALARPASLSYSMWRRIRNAYDALRKERGEEPTSEEVADVLRRSDDPEAKQYLPETIAAFISTWRRRHPHLSQPIGKAADSENPPTYEDVLPQSMFPAPNAGLEARDNKRRIEDLIAGAKPPLTVDEHTVLILKWGLRDGVELTNAQIAHELNLSIVKVQQLHDQSLKKLKKAAKDAAGSERLFVRSSAHGGNRRKDGYVAPHSDAEVRVKQLEDSALWKIRNGQGLTREKAADKPSRMPDSLRCGHFAVVYAKGLCSQCYVKQLNADKPTACGHVPHYAKGLCRSCWVKTRKIGKPTKKGVH